jgi:O-antigen biosynthesis protein
MLSVFTPSHDETFLNDCFASLLAQTEQDWEWLVLLNGQAGDWQVDDDRVRVDRLTNATGTETIGMLKATLCAGASGDILVELDHDDLLAPDCLAEIARAFDRHPDATLVYSDFAHVERDGLTANLDNFDLSMGWTFTTELLDGRAYKRWHSFEPTPPNVGIIWFAPNHVRAFRKRAYREVGGHDPGRAILDDLDLIHRLYLAGPFVRIPRLLYLVRTHEHNSQKDLDRNAAIQVETINLYCQRREALHAAWAARLKGN